MSLSNRLGSSRTARYGRRTRAYVSGVVVTLEHHSYIGHEIIFFQHINFFLGQRIDWQVGVLSIRRVGISLFQARSGYNVRMFDTFRDINSVLLWPNLFDGLGIAKRVCLFRFFLI